MNARVTTVENVLQRNVTEDAAKQIAFAMLTFRDDAPKSFAIHCK
jgi:hypothetical protein